MHMLLEACHLHCMLSLLRWRRILVRLLALLWSAGILARLPVPCLPAEPLRLSACLLMLVLCSAAVFIRS
jgi:hypothetical protein